NVSPISFRSLLALAEFSSAGALTAVPLDSAYGIKPSLDVRKSANSIAAFGCGAFFMIASELFPAMRCLIGNILMGAFFHIALRAPLAVFQIMIDPAPDANISIGPESPRATLGLVALITSGSSQKTSPSSTPDHFCAT